MDLQIGLGMATLYDPASNSQMSLMGNIVTILYSLLFFITNSHVRLLGIAAQSFYIVPLGHRLMQPAAAIYVVEMFSHILAYAIQLALPIIVTQIVVEVAVGILMRMVPQINVFVINLQVKLGVGILVILTIMPAMVKYLEKLNELMLDRVHAGLLVFL
jgi:flagellar biosynthetic protein FliR